MLGGLETLRLDRRDALFLDFDGTLTELGPDPDAIRLADGLGAALEALSARLGGAVAVLSGRDVRDLAGRIPPALWRIGAHGLEIAAPGAAPPPRPAPPPAEVLAPLRRAAEDVAGVWLEIKGAVAALHYRAAPEAEARCRDAADRAAAAAPGHVAQAGKMVVEVKPEGAHKGTALRTLASRAPFAGRRPLMLGDDATDEDAILAAQALGGIGVKIGDGDTAARLRAPAPCSVRAWLRRETAAFNR